MKKKIGIFAIIFMAIIFALSFCACNNTNNDDDPNKNDDPTEEVCTHDWVKQYTVQATCLSPEKTVYICTVCRETKVELAKNKGNHAYINHLCMTCGERDPGVENTNSGDVKVYVYSLVSIGDVNTYTIEVVGNGQMADYDSAERAPWHKYAGQIVSVKFLDGVTHIGAHAFDACAEIKEISFPDTVESIGDYAFNNVKNITSLNLGNNLKKIGKYAFSGCESLTNVDLPKSAVSVAPFAFYQCNRISDMTISVPYTSGNEKINRYFGAYFGYTEDTEGKTFTQKITVDGVTYGFYVPTLLQNLNILEDGVIEDGSFENCVSIRNISLKGMITSIGNYAFRGMENLQYITFEQDSLVSIGEYAFEDCISLGKDKQTDDPDAPPIKQDIILPSTLTDMGTNVFFGCRSLQKVVFNGENVTEIPRGMFEGCSSLNTVILPESLTFINAKAFYACTNLETIVIPKNVKTLSENAFGECSKLNVLYIDSKDVMCIDKDKSKLFKNAKYIYLLNTPKAEVSENSYIKNNYKFIRKVEDSDYYLWG